MTPRSTCTSSRTCGTVVSISPLGYEHREINNQVIADPVQRAGDQLGFNAPANLKNRQEVDSFFTELDFPIVTSTMNVPFMRSLDLSLAWRYEEFDDTDLYATDPTQTDGQLRQRESG